jgi:hypothetical protein
LGQHREPVHDCVPTESAINNIGTSNISLLKPGLHCRGAARRYAIPEQNDLRVRCEDIIIHDWNAWGTGGGICSLSMSLSEKSCLKGNSGLRNNGTRSSCRTEVSFNDFRMTTGTGRWKKKAALQSPTIDTEWQNRFFFSILALIPSTKCQFSFDT